MVSVSGTWHSTTPNEYCTTASQLKQPCCFVGPYDLPRNFVASGPYVIHTKFHQSQS